MSMRSFAIAFDIHCCLVSPGLIKYQGMIAIIPAVADYVFDVWFILYLGHLPYDRMHERLQLLRLQWRRRIRCRICVSFLKPSAIDRPKESYICYGASKRQRLWSTIAFESVNVR